MKREREREMENGKSDSMLYRLIAAAMNDY